MKKHKIVSINGVKIAKKIEKEKDRPGFPRPAIFKDKTKFNRQKSKKIGADEW